MTQEALKVLAMGEALKPLAARIAPGPLEAHYLVHRAVVRGLQGGHAPDLRRAMRAELANRPCDPPPS